MSKLIQYLAHLLLSSAIALTLSGPARAQSDPRIKDFGASAVGGGTNEHIDILGDPNTDYTAFSVLVIVGDGSATGFIDDVSSLETTNANGIWTTPFLVRDFEDGRSSLLLVEGFSGFFGDDLDSDDDGVFEFTPWTRIVDSVSVKDASTTLTTSIDPVSDTPFVGENFLINGDFQVWQRGTSFTASGYWADRFRGEIGGGAIITRQEFALGQTAVPWAPKAYLRHDRTAAAAAANTVLEQRINSVDPHLGSTVTVSLWLRASAPRTFAIDSLQHFDDGGSPDVKVTSQPVSVTGSWSSFALTFTLPSTKGKTAGNSDYLSVRIREEDSFSVFTLDVALFKVERGNKATEFVRKKNQQIIAECLYFYERISAGGNQYFNFAIGSAQTTTSFEAVIFYSRKRTSPTISFSGRFQALIAGSAVSISSPSVVSATGPGNTQSNITGVVSLPTHAFGKAGTWRATNDPTAYIEIDAEL